MTRRTVVWSRKLTERIAADFNGGETQASIATRLGITVKAVSVALCRARKGKPGLPPLAIERRCGFKKKERTDHESV